MGRFSDSLAEGNRLTGTLNQQASTYGRQEFRDVETLLKGEEIPSMEGQRIVDNDGHEWPNIHIR